MLEPQACLRSTADGKSAQLNRIRKKCIYYKEMNGVVIRFERSLISHIYQNAHIFYCVPRVPEQGGGRDIPVAADRLRDRSCHRAATPHILGVLQQGFDLCRNLSCLPAGPSCGSVGSKRTGSRVACFYPRICLILAVTRVLDLPFCVARTGCYALSCSRSIAPLMYLTCDRWQYGGPACADATCDT